SSPNLFPRTVRSLPPCGGRWGRGVAQEKVFEKDACRQRSSRESTSCGTPLPSPPPQGGRERISPADSVNSYAAKGLGAARRVANPLYLLKRNANCFAEIETIMWRRIRTGAREKPS